MIYDPIIDPSEEVRKWVRWLSLRSREHDYDPHVIGESLVNAGISVPEQGHEVVSSDEVQVGDIVRIDFPTWGVWGEVVSTGWSDGLVLRQHTDEWVVCSGATIRRIRRRLRTEPHPELVKNIERALTDFAGQEMNINSGDLPYRLALRLQEQLTERVRNAMSGKEWTKPEVETVEKPGAETPPPPPPDESGNGDE